MSTNVKQNILYSLVLTGANCVFPLLVFPYSSRILGVTNIGICNFISSIVNYFILFSMLGISTVGIREIAKNKDNPNMLSKCFSSLFALNTITTCIAFFLYVLSIFLVPKLNQNSDMMWIGAIQLLFNYLLVDWLYRGLENFKYITIRTIIVRSLYVISVFAFVKERSDYTLFFFLTSITIAINALVNIVYSRKFVVFSLANVNLKPFLSPIIILGLQAILTSMYTTFNVAYLGFTNDENEVGYYTTATKLFGFAIAFFSALTGALLPRMSYYISKNNLDAFKTMLSKTTQNLIYFSFPIIIFCTIYAPEIVNLIAGCGYEKSVIPMRIVMPLLFVIGYEQILIIQTLMPLGNDRDIMINSIVGAVVGLILNFILVDRYGCVGTSFVWVISEGVVLCMAQYFCYKRIKFYFPLVQIITGIFIYLPLGIIILLVHACDLNIYLSVIASIFITLIYFTSVQIFYLKNNIFTNILRNL